MPCTEGGAPVTIRSGRPPARLLLLPDDPVVQEHLGDVYRALKSLEKARRAYLRVLELDPANTSVPEKLKGLSP